MNTMSQRSIAQTMLFLACWSGYFMAPPTLCSAALVGFDWDLVASDVHPALKYFPSATSANVFGFGPFEFLQGGLGTANNISGLPTILASVGGNPSNLTFEFGNFALPLPGPNTTAMPFDAGSFEDGDATGTSVQIYLPGNLPDYDNTLIVKNSGTPIAQGRVTRVVIETIIAGPPKPIPGSPGFFVLDLQSTGRAEFRLDTALGLDATIFDTLLELSNGTVVGTVALGVFNNAGTGGDPALFTSQGFLPIVTADFDIDGDVDGRDFLIWQRGFDHGTSQLAGDANEDGLVGAVDLTIWQAQYGAGTAGTLVNTVAVPEPTSLLLSALASSLLWLRMPCGTVR